MIQQWEQRLGSWAQGEGSQPASPGLGGDRSARGVESRPQPAVAECLESIEQSAMACQFEVLLNCGQYPQGLEHARDALRVVHALEDALSVYRSTSDLATINRTAHRRAVAARVDVCQLLLLAKDVSQATGGAFDITAGALSEAWGFSRRQGRKPSEQELAQVMDKVGAGLVEVDWQQRTVRLLRDGVQLNPGGIGKGYALDRVACWLSAAGLTDYLIHAGRSSVLAAGSRWDEANVNLVRQSSSAEVNGQGVAPGASAPGWWIALAHPLKWETKLGKLRLRNQALGTSGAGKQFFHYQGVRYSHVIDPRTGWPAQGVLSATAVCRSGALADALATAFMVMGVEVTRQFCRQHSQIGAVLVSQVEASGRLAIDCINIAPGDWQAAGEGSPH